MNIDKLEYWIGENSPWSYKCGKCGKIFSDLEFLFSNFETFSQILKFFPNVANFVTNCPNWRSEFEIVLMKIQKFGILFIPGKKVYLYILYTTENDTFIIIQFFFNWTEHTTFFIFMKISDITTCQHTNNNLFLEKFRMKERMPMSGDWKGQTDNDYFVVFQACHLLVVIHEAVCLGHDRLGIPGFEMLHMNPKRSQLLNDTELRGTVQL